MTNQQSIRNSIYNTFLNSKTHGVYNILKSQSRALKTMWICFFTLCAVYCMYLVINTILTFAAYGVNQYNSVVYESPAQFPAIVICNLNPYDSNTAHDEIESILNILNMSQFQSEKFTLGVGFTEDVLSLIKANLDQSAINGRLFQHFLFSFDSVSP